MINLIKGKIKKEFFLIYLFVTLFCFLYYYLIFVMKIIVPDYYLCVEVVDQKLKFSNKVYEIFYPLSCDQKNYFLGFENFNNIITTENYPYQTRSLYVLFVFITSLILKGFNSLFNLELNLLLNITNLICQIFLITCSIYLIDKMLKKYYTYDKKTLFLITGLVTVSPLHKWGIFTPSHQLLTLTVLILGVYILENYRDYKIINISAYMGILYMGHRSFLLVYLIFLLMKYFFQKEREISKYIKSLLVFFVPSIIFYIYIRLLGYYPYDAATEYWGQFIWVLYFLAGKVKSVGEWYCQTIPENFSCYFRDSLNTIKYLLTPLIFIILKQIFDKFLYKKNQNNLVFYTIIFSFVMFAFYSLIGWYPPLRFNLYSIGNCLVFISCIQVIENTKLYEKILYSGSIFLYFVNLNHWNYPEVVMFNRSIYVVVFMMVSYFLVNFMNNKEIIEKNKS